VDRTASAKGAPHQPTQSSYDLAIIGGGINGTAIAAAAASAGLSTVLLESSDLASGGSSSTLGLLSGDLNLLDQLAFDRVRQHLKEQQTAQRRAPHLVHPHHCFLLDQPEVRSSRRVSTGMKLYRRLQCQLPIPSNGLAPAKLLRKPQLTSYPYIDCSFDSSRYVTAQALLAANQGAEIFNYTPAMSAKRCQESRRWLIWLLPQGQNQEQSITAKALINASGADTGNLLGDTMQLESRCQVTPIDSISLVIRGLDPAFSQHGFCFQAPNRQLIQLIPCQFPPAVPTEAGPLFRLSCSTPPQQLEAQQRQDWLLDCVNQQLMSPITPEQVLSYSCGQRNLCREAWLKLQTESVPTEPALVDFDCRDGHSPLINIFSSHLSAHRLMAEQTLEMLTPYFGDRLNREKIQAHAQLPLAGGDFDHTDLGGFIQRLEDHYPQLAASLLHRIALQYGSNSRKLLGSRQTRKDLGQKLAPELYAFEVDYLLKYEWASCAEDILKRRCAIEHLCDAADIERVQQYIAVIQRNE